MTAYITDISSGSRHPLGDVSTVFSMEGGYRFLGSIHPDLEDGQIEIFREAGGFRLLTLPAEARLVRQGNGFIMLQDLWRYREMGLNDRDELEVGGKRFRFEETDFAGEIVKAFREECFR